MLAEGTIPADIEAFLLSQKTVHGALMSIWKSLTPGDQVDLSKGEIHDHQGESYLQRWVFWRGTGLRFRFSPKRLRTSFSGK